MMRTILIVPLCLAAAACGSGDNSANDQEAAAPATLPAGTWNAEFEVTSFRSTDQTTPALKAKVGDKEQASICVPSGQSERPPANLFAGGGYECTYSNSYNKNGILNATLFCTRPELKGQINMTVEGSYDAKSFEATVNSTSYLPGNGDFAMGRKVKGKLSPGACQPAAPAADSKGAAKGGAKPGAKAGG